MRKKILVLQFRTDKSLIHERSCIIRSGNFKQSDFHFVNVLNSQSKLPEIKDLINYRGIILGGSGQTEICRWTETTKTKIMKIEKLIKKSVSDDMPMLNICFGHQLIAYFLGGKVEADPKQAETGTYKINLNKNCQNSPLFKGIPMSFYAVLGHKDSVTKLPIGAKLLACSDKCGVQSYQIKNNIYCVQFHPELNKKGMIYRLNLFPSYVKDGDINKILNKYKKTHFASRVIRNFLKICVDVPPLDLF